MSTFQKGRTDFAALISSAQQVWNTFDGAIGEMLIEALPFAGYDPTTYRLHGAPATGLLNEGDTVDLGNHLYEVLHLPGHSPGGIGLFERATGILFAADAIHDGPLVYDGPGMNVAACRKTFAKLRGLSYPPKTGQ